MRKRRLLLPILLGLGLTLVVLSVFVTSPARADGVTYYVNAATGNDTTGDGTSGNPWKTLTHAAANVPAAGDPANPNIIEVAAETYNTALGETFPIDFTNANIKVTGASSATTIIDASNSISDIIRIDAAGITIEGFTLQNSTDDGIVLAGGGRAVISNNTFATAGEGIDIELWETLDGTPYTIQPITITHNTFNSGANSGIEIDIDLDGNGTTTPITIGAISIIANTFATTNGLYVNDFDIFHIDGGAITVGDLLVANNTFDSTSDGIFWYETGTLSNITDTIVILGNVSVADNTFTDQTGDAINMDFSIDLDYFTDTTLTTGDVTIISNTITNQGDYGIAVYFYDQDDWSGTSSGTFGDLIVRDNTVNSSGSSGSGIYAYQNWPSSITDTTVITVGDALIENNWVSSGGTGIETGPGGGYYSDTVAVSMGRTVVQSNTITSAGQGSDEDDEIAGIYIDHEFAYDVHDSSIATGGAVLMAGNEITATSNGIYLGIFYPGYDMDGTAQVTVDPITITHNTVTADDYNGIYIYYYEVAYSMIEDSSLIMGPVTIEDNVISSADDDALEIYYQDYEVGYDMYNNAYAKLPDHIIRGNTFNAGVTDDYAVYWNSYQNPYYVDDNSTIDFGQFVVDDNTFNDAYYGVYYYNGEPCYECYGNHTAIFSDTIVTNNRFTNQTDTAVYVDIEYAGVVSHYGNLIFGETLVSGNVITNADYGIYYYNYEACYDCYDDAALVVGDITVTDNRLQNMAEEGITIDLDELGYDQNDNVATEIGNTLIKGNIITTTNYGIGTYFYVSDPDVNSTVNTGWIEISDNTVSDATQSGIIAEYYSDLDDTSTSVFSRTLIANNTIEADASDDDEAGIYLEYGADSNYNDTTAEFGKLSVVSNTITVSDGPGLWLYYNDLGYEAHNNTLVTVGAVDILSNTIDSYDEAIYIGYEDVGYDMDDSAQVLMGDHTIAWNDLTAEDDGLYIGFYGEYVGLDMDGNSYVKLPDYNIHHNTIRADYDGIGFESYSNPYSLYGNAAIDFGTFTVDSNTITGAEDGDGIYHYTYAFCGSECLNSSGGTIGDITITNNHVQDFDGDGVNVEHEGLGGYYDYDDDGEYYTLQDSAIITVGNTLVSGNVITNTNSDAIEVYFETWSSEDARITLGSAEISDNTITDADYGIYMPYYLDPYDDTALQTVGDAVIKNNTITTCDGDGIDSKVRTYNESDAITMNRVEIITNTVTNCDDGIYVDDMFPGVLISNNQLRNSDSTGLEIEMGTDDQAEVISNTITNTSPGSATGVKVYGGQVNLSTTNPVNHAISVYNDGGVITTTTALAADYDIRQDSGTFLAQNNTLTIGDDLILSGGDFYAPTGLVPTGSFTHTGGTYYQTKTVNGSTDVGFPKAGGLILNANNLDLGSTDVAITAGAQCSGASNSVEHCYVITPTNTTGRNADATFYFNGSELADQKCSTLEGYYWDGTWDNVLSSDTPQCSTEPRSVDSTGLDTFGAFALHGDPWLTVTKEDKLLTDVGDSGLSAGDTLQYTIVISNPSLAQFDSLQLTDTPDTNTTLVTGTVTSTGGSVTTGNGTGDTEVEVSAGSIAAGSAVTVTFNVTLNDPLPDDIQVITNQAVISGSWFSDFDSDDPNTTTADDATVTRFITTLYFPVIVSNYRPLPDLVITDLQMAGQAITVTLQNQGDTTAVNDFWVDVYFNPDHEPVLNDRWDSIGSDAGAVWGVTANIGAGDSLTLTVGDAYYWPTESSATFPDGATVYGYVDSINFNTTYGNVEERDEGNNLWPGSGAAGVQVAGGGGAPTSGLPGR